jgi:hypothetical protein
MEWPSNSAFRLQIAIFAERELDFDTPQAGGLAAVGVIIAAYSSRYLADNLSGWPLAATVSAWASIAAFIGYAVLGSRR